MDKKKTSKDANSITNLKKKKKETSKKSKVKSRGFKPIIIATISAIVIGSVLGVMMLTVFTNLDEKNSSQQDDNQLASVDLKDDKNHEEDEADDVQAEKINAFVLQGGVFSEKENAEAWLEKYDQSKLQPVIWERENQYFLLAGLADTREHAETLASEIKQQGFDIYVKEWSTNEVELNLAKEEQEWLNDFYNQWNQTLESISEQDEFPVKSWNDLINEKPKNTDELENLIDSIDQMNLSEEGPLNDFDEQNTLLNMWLTYENTIH